MKQPQKTAAIILLFALSLSTLAAEPVTKELSISEALELASTGADAVRAKTALVAAAKASVDSSRSNFLPKISTTVSGAWLANPPEGMSLKAGEMGVMPAALGGTKIPATDITFIDDTKSTYFKGNVTLSQPLFTWGKIGSAAAIASLEERIAAAGQVGAILDAKRQVETAYFTVAFCRQTKPLLVSLREMAASNVSDKNLALVAGLATKEQLLSAKSDLADIDARIVEIDQTEKTSLYALGILTGLDTASLDLVSPFRTALPTIDEQTIEDRSAQVGESSVTARRRLEEANKKLDIAKGSTMLLPDLQLFSSFDFTGQTVPFSKKDWMDKTWTWDLTVGVAAKTDLFDGGASYANIRGAKAGRDAATSALSAQESAARMAARNAIDAARRAEAAIAQKTAHGEWYAEALKAATASFDNQLASRADLNLASMRELLGRVDLLQAQYNLEQAIADLELVNGGSFQ